MRQKDNAPYSTLLRAESDETSSFSYIEPPFNFNHSDVAVYPAEVSGYFLLKSLSRRLRWDGLTGKRLLDFGCGVRFARTIVNLGLDIETYSGIDTNPEPIEWLRGNIKSPRFRFDHFDIPNAMYNPHARSVDAGILADAGFVGNDAACMFSVITHNNPNEAKKTFDMLYPCVMNGGAMYFTAFVDESVSDYIERDPTFKGHMCTYNPGFLLKMLSESGWRVSDIYPPSELAMTAFVCWKDVESDV